MSSAVPASVEPPACLLDDVEVARRLNLAPITLRKWRLRAAGPPFVKLGRVVRYSWPAVEAWLAAQTVGRKVG